MVRVYLPLEDAIAQYWCIELSNESERRAGRWAVYAYVRVVMWGQHLRLSAEGVGQTGGSRNVLSSTDGLMSSEIGIRARGRHWYSRVLLYHKFMVAHTNYQWETIQNIIEYLSYGRQDKVIRGL
jgi:hypothetical protein